MSKYRHALPQLSDKLFLTDGGLETTLVFEDGMDLPCFASFPLLLNEAGRERLRRYYELYSGLARQSGLGFVLESVGWRANRDWGVKLGYDAAGLAEATRASVDLLVEFRDRYDSVQTPMVISGNVGPRGDGYVPGEKMSAAAAEAYHGVQVATYADTEADMVSAFTINYVEEAIGIARAAAGAGLPSVISFTLETDGRLPSGQGLAEAIAQTDAESGVAPAYYMINCAHPTHFDQILEDRGAWLGRIRGVRANASTRSHAELDAATELDAGDPVDLGRRYASLRRRMPRLTVLGGCCGTDHRHVAAISRFCAPVSAAA
jgi:S-methylmethionine-dependent homocysteine/selenocysteine methylase